MSAQQPDLPLFDARFERVFERPGPRWFTLAPHRPFLDDLAKALYEALSPLGPETLADALVLTPTRRGARLLAEAFVRAASGRAVLLPQIRALGDLEEGEPPFEPGDVALDLPPAIRPLQRRFELARLSLTHAARLGERNLTPQGALDLADTLAAFLDSLAIEEISNLSAVAPCLDGDLAEHWKHAGAFVQAVLADWPGRLSELGVVDVNVRRTTLLRALAQRWREAPPTHAVVAAGSTGSAPATADLLAVVASLPKGVVVLPGLDPELADEAWAQVGDAHPQGGLKRLLDKVGVARNAVAAWPNTETPKAAMRGRARRRLVNEALRPPDATDDWLKQIALLRAEGRPDEDPIAEGLAGLSLVSARNETEAAAVAALALREALEVPGRTAALITPDASFARRVSARLRLWDVAADASAGAPLSLTSRGVLIGLLARAAAEPLNPAVLLGLLKHPLARLGREALSLQRAARTVEEKALRGARPASFEQLFRRIIGKDDETLPAVKDALAVAEALRDVVARVRAPFALGPASASDAARALGEALEALAADKKGALGELWAGTDGEAAAGLVAGLIGEAEAAPALDARAFADLVDRLLADQPVRAAESAHARISVLGALEARLVRADLLVLAGLEEGVWPKTPRLDPFLSRDMREAVGLPQPERRIGLAAHDFAQAAAAPEVLMIHTERRGGQPTVKSRWLWRLETLAKGAGVALPRRDDLARLAETLAAPLDSAPEALKPATRPAPAPPVAARPRELAVTEVETWVRDPYALYAKKILSLRQLPPPAADMDARHRGTAIHAAVEAFAKAWPLLDPKDAPAKFRDLYLDALKAEGLDLERLAVESALAERLGVFMAGFEGERRADGAQIIAETAGETEILVDGEAFTLKARADRIEVMGSTAMILDFKTGSYANEKQVASGFAPQLPLSAAILARGGFTGVSAKTPTGLLYVRLTGRDPAGVVEVRRSGEEQAAADAAWRGLSERVRSYRDPKKPYRSRVAMQFVKDPSDYDHLARTQEWLAADEDEGGE